HSCRASSSLQTSLSRAAIVIPRAFATEARQSRTAVSTLIVVTVIPKAYRKVYPDRIPLPTQARRLGPAGTGQSAQARTPCAGRTRRYATRTAAASSLPGAAREGRPSLVRRPD